MEEKITKKLVFTYNGGNKNIQVIQMKIPDLKKGLPPPPGNRDNPDWRDHYTNTDPVTDEYIKQTLDRLNKYIGDLIEGAEFHVEEVKIKTTRSNLKNVKYIP